MSKTGYIIRVKREAADDITFDGYTLDEANRQLHTEFTKDQIDNLVSKKRIDLYIVRPLDMYVNKDRDVRPAGERDMVIQTITI
jgi:hypothetical protein